MHTEQTFIALTALVGIFTAIAMMWDLRTRRLPNWLTVGALAAALIFHTATGGWSGLLHALGGFAVGFGMLLVLWLIGGGGGGDVKLMGALGAWLGATLTLIVFVGSALFGVVCFLAMVVWTAISGAPAPLSAATAGAGASSAHSSGNQKLAAPRRRIPYAVPVALATWTILIVKLLAMNGAG